MATNVYWDGATATFAGPNAPSLPTPFWLKNNVTPYVLHYWLDAPDNQYVPLGNIDPTANTFTPLGGSAGSMSVIDNGDGTFTFTDPNANTSVTIKEFDIDRLPDSSVWATGDTLAKENAGGTEQEADADAYIADVLQSGPQSSALLAAMTASPAPVEEIVVGTSLPATPTAGDIAWLETGVAPNRNYSERIYLNGTWQGTSRSFDEASMSFVTPPPPTTPHLEEIFVGTSLPTSPNEGDIAWLETGTAPNRDFDEQIYLDGAWRATSRSYDEATAAFVVPTQPTTPPLEEIFVGTSLPISPNEGDIAWLETGTAPNRDFDEQIYLDGAWRAASRSYDEATAAFVVPTSPSTPPLEEIFVGTSLPASPNEGDIAWLETGTAPNRVFDEQIYLNGGWHVTGRTFDEATGAFVLPSAPASTSGGAGPVAVFYQQEPRGVTGGDIPGGGWRDRILNTQQFNGITGLSLNTATGEFTFAASSAPRNFWVKGRAALSFYDYQQGFIAIHHQTRIATSGGVQQIIGESSFGANQDGGPQSGNTTHANIEGVLTVPAGGGTYNFQHANNWSFSSWNTKQGEAVGRGMDLVNLTTLGGPEVYATLSLQEIA